MIAVTIIYLAYKVANYMVLHLKYGKENTKIVELNENFQVFGQHDECVMLIGHWGSGKTYQYQNRLKPNIWKQFKRKQIYVSCFSANKAELISNIIKQDFLFKLITLNGLLNSFIFSSWQSFMPTKSIIILDDIERLHSGNDNYLDLLGVIDFLKEANKILLICDKQKIESSLFNDYMEKIVDRVINVNELYVTKNTGSKYSIYYFLNDIANKYGQLYYEIRDLLEERLDIIRSELPLFNIRLIRNSFYSLLDNLNTIIKQFDIKHEIVPTLDEKILVAFIRNSAARIELYVKLNHLFFKDNILYNKLLCKNGLSEIQKLIHFARSTAEEKDLENYRNKLLASYKINLDELKFNELIVNPLRSMVNSFDIYQFIFEEFLNDNFQHNEDYYTFNLIMLACGYNSYTDGYAKFVNDTSYYRYIAESKTGGLDYDYFFRVKDDQVHFLGKDQFDRFVVKRKDVFNSSILLKMYEILHGDIKDNKEIGNRFIYPNYFIWCAIWNTYGKKYEVDAFIHELVIKKYKANSLVVNELFKYFVWFYEENVTYQSIYQRIINAYDDVLWLYIRKLWDLAKPTNKHEYGDLEYLTLLSYNYHIEQIKELNNNDVTIIPLIEKNILDEKISQNHNFHDNYKKLLVNYFFISYKVKHVLNKDIVKLLYNDYKSEYDLLLSSKHDGNNFVVWLRNLPNEKGAQ